MMGAAGQAAGFVGFAGFSPYPTRKLSMFRHRTIGVMLTVYRNGLEPTPQTPRTPQVGAGLCHPTPRVEAMTPHARMATTATCAERRALAVIPFRPTLVALPAPSTDPKETTP